MGEPRQPRPPLSPQRSFVVQFRAETAAEPEAYNGRVEHLTSGQATLFSSPEELLAFIARVLATMRTESSHEQ
jgi:hypothetical protein